MLKKIIKYKKTNLKMIKSKIKTTNQHNYKTIVSNNFNLLKKKNNISCNNNN